jgi:ABC-type multidrug transport system ATPase subunit/ABC-type multidrug transport system permease subunit
VASTTCPYCSAPLRQVNQRFCPKCGRELTPASAPAAAAPPNSVPTTLAPTAPLVAPDPAALAPAGGPVPAGAPAPAGATRSGGRTRAIGDPGALATAPAGAHLIVQDGGASQTFALDARPQTIGRAPDSDILLSSRFVSAHHARIEPVGQTHQISDVGSTNGLLFEGRRLAPNSPLPLADGAVLRIGDPATGNFITLTYRNPEAQLGDRAARIRRSHPLNPQQAQIAIGREQCDIVLDNPQVSRRHALIERDGPRHVLSDVGSTNGTFVNGQRISRRALQPGDVIQIGAFKLVYDGDSLDEFDQRGAMRIDARRLNRSVRRAGQARLILRDVSLSIAPREFVALVGGSGTGKSTLLNALSGNVLPSAGQVLVNGDDFYRNFDAYRAVLGYVPQDDILHRPLTVDRALHYAARLRLPADTASAEIDRRIAQVLDDVEMGAHRDTPVDNLSGGQRKRVSIAAELLADPSLFFLDEPTSGLDPGLEKKMMYTLRRLADSGRTIVLVTHATANITQCDHVAFMADGRMVYFGPPDEALQFFNVSSGDFADIYTKLDGQADPNDADRWAIVRRDLQPEYDAWMADQQSPSNGQPPARKVAPRGAPTLAELWERRFRASPQYTRYVSGRLAQAPAVPGAGDAGDTSRQLARVSPLRQFSILTRRYTELLTRDQRNLLILLLQAPLISALLALVSSSGALSGLRGGALTVLCMLAVVAVWFGIINAAREIAKEEPVYRRERLANLRIGPYVLSKVVVLFVLVLIQSALLLGMFALKVNIPAAGVLFPAWIELFITTVLTSLAGLAAGLAISAFASTPDRAISLVPLALVPQILLAGVIFNLGDGYTLQRVLSWLTISRWAMDAYGSTININALEFQPGVHLREPSPEYLDSGPHLLSRWGVLLLMLLVYLGVTAWLLKRRDRKA